jgi:hypothetical protein
MDVRERDGSFVLDISQDQVTLEEDGLQQDLHNFDALDPGIQLVVAFNISPPFAIQDINGNSRFDFIKTSLLDWSDQIPSSGPDDLSLISNDGLEVTHQQDRDQFKSVLEEYNPNLRETESNFNVLARAIEIASDPVDQPGMKRVVLFISSAPSLDASDALPSLLAQAQDSQVLIYTLLISSPAFFTTAGALQLQNLSIETGGEHFPFSGEEPLPDFSLVFNPLRNTYLLEYQTLIITPGIHTIEASITDGPGETIGRREFFLDVQPPNPIFISPPQRITRNLVNNDLNSDGEVILEPDTYDLEILVEFPDNLPRELAELILRVDGEIVERKISPPYTRFVWDLRDYQFNATHQLTLEAVDIMGLSRVSLSTPIEIIVENQPPVLGKIISDNAAALGGLSLVIVFGLLLFLLISQGRIKPTGGFNSSRTGYGSEGLFSGSFFKNLLSGKTELSEIDHQIIPQPIRLIPINDISRELFLEPITLSTQEVQFGSSSGKNQIIIPHASVNQEHSIIRYTENQDYTIEDLESGVGTWINYEQIPSSRAKILQDGDIIHIGEAGFRFQVLESIIPEISTEEKKN